MSAQTPSPRPPDLRRRLLATGVAVLATASVLIGFSTSSGASPGEAGATTTVSIATTTSTSTTESTTVPVTIASTTAPPTTSTTTREVVRIGSARSGRSDPAIQGLDVPPGPGALPVARILPATGSAPLAPTLTGIALVIAGALAAGTKRRRQLTPIRVKPPRCR